MKFLIDRWSRRGERAPDRAVAPPPAPVAPNPTRSGAAAEDRALAHLLADGLVLLARNYRTPGRGGGEIDLILRDPDGTLVFVEVRQRVNPRYGGAAASIGVAKQRRIVFAARHWLLRWAGTPPPCRFDVVLIDAAGVQWLRAAFDAG